MWVKARCGCEIEVEMGYDWPMCSCCSGSEYVESAEITSTCEAHTPLDKSVEA